MFKRDDDKERKLNWTEEWETEDELKKQRGFEGWNLEVTPTSIKTIHVDVLKRMRGEMAK